MSGRILCFCRAHSRCPDSVPSADQDGMAQHAGSNLKAVASNLRAMAFNLSAVAFNLIAMASNHRAMTSNLSASILKIDLGSWTMSKNSLDWKSTKSHSSRSFLGPQTVMLPFMKATGCVHDRLRESIGYYW